MDEQRDRDPAAIDEVYNLIVTHALYPFDVRRRETVSRTIRSMCDTYTRLVAKGDFYNRNSMQNAHKFFDCGIDVTYKSGCFMVRDICAESRTMYSGVQSGDTILSVNDDPVDSLDPDTSSLMEIRKSMTGPPSSDVTLTIRKKTGAERACTLQRDVRRKFVTRLPGVDVNVPVLRIEQFTSSTKEDLEKCLGHLHPAARGVVLDLRGNPGGLMKSGLDVLSLFLDAKDAYFMVKRRETTKEKTLPGAPFLRMPLCLIVDDSTASTSEIVASALKYHRAVPVVGDWTWGKGVAQEQFSVESLKCDMLITTAKWHSADGDCIHEKGLEPDALCETGLDHHPDGCEECFRIATDMILDRNALQKKRTARAS